jgi:hypothetical protein
MNRPVVLLAAVAAAAIGAVALALPAAADTPVNITGVVGTVVDTVASSGASAASLPSAGATSTMSSSATAGSTATATVASTATANPARGDALVAADVCAALTVGGLHVLGQDSGLSALLHATLNVGADSDADRVTAARRALGCAGSGSRRDARVDAKVCAALTVGKLTTVLDRLDADAELGAVVDSARDNLGDTVAKARRTLCSGSGSTVATMTTSATATTTVEATPAPIAVVPAPVGAPETGA